VEGDSREPIAEELAPPESRAAAASTAAFQGLHGSAHYAATEG
jgi:hypothetical protein